MTTTKDPIRTSAWFTSSGLPDPRMEGPERKSAMNPGVYLDGFVNRIRKFFTPVKLSKAKENFL